MTPCPSCQRQNADDAVVCAGCGRTLARVTPSRVDALSDTVRSSRGNATSALALAEARVADAELFPSGLDTRYEILRKIGEGGMGAVYEARHTVIGKRVAIKVLLDKYIAKADVVARLLQEARLASSIGHENIIDITDCGETAGGRSFMVMEYLDGESLHDLLLREGCLAPSRALPIVRQVASALGAAHGKGVVHRDVKPENIFIVRRGDRDFVKVVDFGISKALKVDDAGDLSPRLTTTGMILGTPLYLSPEQARGEEDLDHRIDVYALGVVLYETLTGEVPFHGANYLSIISQILEKDAQPPSALRGDLGLSPDIDAVVARAMAKDRAVRYQTMAELDADLARLEGGTPPRARTAPPAPAVRRRRWPRVIGWAAGVLAVALAVALSVPRLLAEDVPRPETVVTEVTPVPVPVPQPPAPPPTVHMTVTSEPSGAEVWRESVRLGATPYTMELPQRDEPVELTLKLDGYDDTKARFYPTADGPVAVTMTKKPPPPRVVKRPPPRPARPAADRGPTSGGEIKPSPFGK